MHPGLSKGFFEDESRIFRDRLACDLIGDEEYARFKDEMRSGLETGDISGAAVTIIRPVGALIR